jgi:hypothetical protein
MRRTCGAADKGKVNDDKARLSSDAPSLNPPSDYLYGKSGRSAFLYALFLCCAQAAAQCCETHPLHEAVMRDAKASRDRVQEHLAYLADVEARRRFSFSFLER